MTGKDIRVSSSRLPWCRRGITVTPGTPDEADEVIVDGEIKQGRKTVPLVWESGVGAAIVRSGPCAVIIRTDRGQWTVYLERHKRTWPQWGHRAPKMPRRHAEYR